MRLCQAIDPTKSVNHMQGLCSQREREREGGLNHWALVADSTARSANDGGTRRDFMQVGGARWQVLLAMEEQDKSKRGFGGGTHELKRGLTARHNSGDDTAILACSDDSVRRREEGFR